MVEGVVMEWVWWWAGTKALLADTEPAGWVTTHETLSLPQWMRAELAGEGGVDHTHLFPAHPDKPMNV